MKERRINEFLIVHVSQEKVLAIIKSLENKTTGPASIPIKLLKLIRHLILIPLCNIINVSFSTRVFPSLLKIGKVIPIHKDGSTQDMINYHPISLLSIFDKIIEKLMHKRLIHLWKKVIFYITNSLGLAKETQPQMH